MRILLLYIALCFGSISCQEDEPKTDENTVENPFISAVDISRYPEIMESSPVFYDSGGTPKNFLDILKENGVNTIRLRLWVNPSNEHSSLEEVKIFSQSLRSKGFKIWLTLHYSDTWADPGHQTTPTEWQDFNLQELKTEVYAYTQLIMNEINPEYIQIGNEINNGFLHPLGNLHTNFENFIELVSEGISAVRNHSTNTKIILHFAGIENSEWFFNQVQSLDYDIIGLSYYPIWHGKDLNHLKNTLQNLANVHHKEVLIAETAYPFTLNWNDWTNNIVGLESQLILPQFPATEEGQRLYLQSIKQMMQELSHGIGFCYWGGELIAWKGSEATDASPWENQALFDFQNHAVAALEVFKLE